MNNIILINGPNLNLLGKREQSQYGSITFDELKSKCLEHSKKIGVNIDFFQSNLEGEIVGKIQESIKSFDRFFDISGVDPGSIDPAITRVLVLIFFIISMSSL